MLQQEFNYSSKLVKPLALNAVQGDYPIVETFLSIQGEGYWSGTSAYFIRLGGCDVGCPWCDQKETWYQKRHPVQSAQDLSQQAMQSRPAIVVITGGEPLLQDLELLTQLLKRKKLRIHLETSGAYPLSGQFDWITLSPKPFKPPQGDIYAQVNELKVIVSDIKDLSWAEEQAGKIPENAKKYLQPEWNSSQSQQLCMDYILENPSWCLSLQTHKYLGVR